MKKGRQDRIAETLTSLTQIVDYNEAYGIGITCSL